MKTVKAALRLLWNLSRLLALSLRGLFQSSSVSILLKLRDKRKLKGGRMEKEKSLFTDGMEIPEAAGLESGTIPIPPETETGGTTGFSDTTTTELTPLCEDLIGLPFEAWDMFAIKPKRLTDFERGILGKRLAQILVKHGMDKKITEEAIFLSVLSLSVAKRVNDERKAVKQNNDNRQDGAGEINAVKGAYPAG